MPTDDSAIFSKHSAILVGRLKKIKTSVINIKVVSGNPWFRTMNKIIKAIINPIKVLGKIVSKT